MHKIIELIDSKSNLIRFVIDGTINEIIKNYPDLYEFKIKPNVECLERKFDTIDDCIYSLYQLIVSNANLTDVPDLSPYNEMEKNELTKIFVLCIKKSMNSKNKILNRSLSVFRNYLIQMFKTGDYNYKFSKYGDNVKYVSSKELEKLYQIAEEYNKLGGVST